MAIRLPDMSDNWMPTVPTTFNIQMVASTVTIWILKTGFKWILDSIGVHCSNSKVTWLDTPYTNLSFEYQTSPVFRWLLYVVWVLTGLIFKCHSKSEQTHHSKSDQNGHHLAFLCTGSVLEWLEPLILSHSKSERQNVTKDAKFVILTYRDSVQQNKWKIWDSSLLGIERSEIAALHLMF